LFKSTVFGNATICRSQFFGSPGLPASIASGTADTVAPYMYIKA